MRSLWLVLTLVVLEATSAYGQRGVDTTIHEGAGGTAVVNAVIDLLRSSCILTSDRMFLRRVAYVETVDGTLSTTYRPGYDGGIWKVDEHMFQATRSCSGVIRTTCDLIQDRFNIDWRNVQWSDLRKPLYSGIAATLYVLQQTNGDLSQIPVDIGQQATFWIQHYDVGGFRANYTLNAAEATRFDCDRGDIAFIIDSSGSIDNADFARSIDFVARMVDAMNVQQDAVRIAALIFESSPTIQFYFNTYSTKSQVLSAIRNIQRTSGGTSTYLALDTARTSFFTGSPRGARVAVLVTDGQSGSITLTTEAARRLKEETGAILFAIGVGGYNLAELQATASDPNCTHVFTVNDFTQMDTILYEIQKATCNAPLRLPTVSVSGNATGPQEPVVYTGLPGNGTETLVVSTGSHTSNTTNSTKETTVKVDVNCGILHIYVSYDNPNPSAAFYREKYTATDEMPAIVTTSTNEGGQQLYMTVVGTNLPTDVAQLKNCSDFYYNVTVADKPFRLRCCREGSCDCQPCTEEQLRQETSIQETVCFHYNEEFPNPCTSDAQANGQYLFTYPYDQSKFIRCDSQNNPYVIICPNRQSFDPNTLTCGYSTPGTGGRQRLPSSYPNPCTHQHIQEQHFYFEYPPNPQKYIYCETNGDAWLVSCPVLQIWDPREQTCMADVPETTVTTTPATPLTNPCTPDAETEGRQYFVHPCDHTKYIHCGPAGTMWVMNCPAGMFYHPEKFVCVHDDPQHTKPC